MKKLFYLFTILFAIAFAACDNGQPEGPSGDSNVPEKPSSPTTGSFVAKPFSVSESKTVTFSPGNLQYHPANNEWRFAPSQLDYVGADNAKISPSYNGWIDLFGWRTGNNPTNQSPFFDDYPTFVDWGVNKIGNDAPNTWRTLTDDEWYYLCWSRPNADKLIGVAQVNGVNGLILLPDNWTCPSGVTFKSGFHNNFGTEYYAEYQTFSSSEWTKLEASGAVFFPAAGLRYCSGDVGEVGSYGNYWSSTPDGSDSAYDFYFSSGKVYMSNGYRCNGQSVRLVTTLASPQEPNKPSDPSTPGSSSYIAKPFSVSATKTVTFSPGNLQYHPANNEWRFAPNQTDYIGEANANISASYNGWIDLFGWGTGSNPTNTSYNCYVDYLTFVDWGVNQIGTYAPNTWRTLTYNEWNYLIKERPNYDKLIGVAHVNGVNGLILLPDGWTCPSGVTFKSGFHNNFGTEYYAEYQTFSSSEWTKLEASGAVFFPAAGYRYCLGDVYEVGSEGDYWSSTPLGSDRAYYLFFRSGKVGMSYDNRCGGLSVRLVQD